MMVRKLRTMSDTPRGVSDLPAGLRQERHTHTEGT